MEQMNIFDLMGEEGEQFKPIKSNDWKWSFADYPKEKNGLKVFGCFACGMSVPPIMIKRIVNRLIESGAFKYKNIS